MKPMPIALVGAAIVFFIFISTGGSQLLGDAMWFYGTSSWNGNPTPPGTVIEARIGGEFAGDYNTTKEGAYGGPKGGDKKLIVFGEKNDAISFFMRKPTMSNFSEANEQAVFAAGTVAELNLTFDLFCGDAICDTASESCSSCPADCGSCAPPPSGGGAAGGGGGGSSGGGGGGGFAPPPSPGEEEPEETGNEIPEETAICEERWTCTDWSSCADGRQTRECRDRNACGTELGKPSESQGCLEVQAPAQPPSPPAGGIGAITGLITVGPAGMFGIAAVVIILLGALIFWAASRNGRRQEKPANGKKRKK
ncbi:MAG: hypothetical protein HY520_03050 [Candidatus Aenigmarchaeota archaeon]|nr:hypothetical protein [Candidatus Aenigmarchaeota archaeon]